MDHQSPIILRQQSISKAVANEEGMVQQGPLSQFAPPPFQLKVSPFVSPKQQPADLAPLQLKQVSKEKLNVIGEDNHDEADEVRGGEQLVAHQEAEGGYWEEDTFWVFKDETETDWQWGDDRVLLFKQAMGNLAQFGHLALQLLGVYNLRNAAEDDTLEGKRDQAASMITTETRELLGHYRDNQDRIPEFQQILDNNLIFIALGDFITKVERLQEIIVEFSQTRVFDDTAESEAKELVAEIAPRHLNMGGVAQERSNHMLDSANKGAHIKGIWKVGDAHIPDIQNSQEVKNFEVLTHDEFYADYGAMIEENKDREYIKDE